MILQINTNSKSIDDESGNSAIYKRKIEALNNIQLENFSQLTGSFPSPGELFALWTIKQFNAFSMIMAMINTYDKIDHLTLSSYNISRKSVHAFAELLDDNKISRMDLYVSDVAKSMFPKSFEVLNEFNARLQNLNVFYVWNHSKIAAAKCGDNYFVCEGSGNFSSNARHEQYILINSKEFYEFRKSCIGGMQEQNQ